MLSRLTKRSFSVKVSAEALQLYRAEHERSLKQPEQFWHQQAMQVPGWSVPPPLNSVLTKDQNGIHRWFKGGKLNISGIITDHVANQRPNQPALFHDSPTLNIKHTITYATLKDQVGRLAHVLQNKFGIQKGDRVVIYMPMCAEAAIAMLAVARLGAIHSVVFGGFAAHELSVRINDLSPKLVIAATGSMEIDRLVDYAPIVQDAFKESKVELPVLFFDRHELRHIFPKLPHPSAWPKNFFNMTELMEKTSAHAPVEQVDATHPFYVLYTSGTTGKPKGIVRDHGSAVSMLYAMRTILDNKPGETIFTASDVGWVVGHVFSLYAPLLNGASSVFYEGKPVKTPDAGAFWRVCSEYKASQLYAAPTAWRAIRKEDPEGELMKKYDLSRLRTVCVAGERLDPPTLHWMQKILPNQLINDNWWQTESGWPICGIPTGLTKLPIKPGSCTVPMPGFDVKILDEHGKEKPAGEQGQVVIKLPLPPSALYTIYNNHERFVKGYLTDYPGYYLTGDGGYIDEDGYLFVMGRTDDVLNVAGHRLSTGEMEEVLNSHPAVAECAIVAVEDSLKGEVPVGVVVVKDTVKISEEQLAKELVSLVRHKIGAVASFRQAAVVKRLPKTRSGKILRKTMREIAKKEHVPTPATIDDPLILDEIRAVFKTHRIGSLYNGDASLFSSE